jgi:hypothetical protein
MRDRDGGAAVAPARPDTSSPSSTMAVDCLVPENSEMQFDRPSGWERTVTSHLSARPPQELASTVQVRSACLCALVQTPRRLVYLSRAAACNRAHGRGASFLHGLCAEG